MAYLVLLVLGYDDTLNAKIPHKCHLVFSAPNSDASRISIATTIDYLTSMYKRSVVTYITFATAQCISEAIAGKWRFLQICRVT
jgi:hypothetical protein